MANSARDLLNYVDEHKQEMKEGIYKEIVDRLVPINKELEQNKKTKYEVFFLVTYIHRNVHDKDRCEATYHMKSTEAFLSKTDVDFLNKRLDQGGVIVHFWRDDIKKSQGLQMLETLRQIFLKGFETVVLSCDLTPDNDESEMKDAEILYSNEVVITRIKKVE